MNWNNLTISQYEKLIHLTTLKFEDEIDYAVEALSIILNKPIDFFYDLPISKLGTYIKELEFLSVKPSGELRQVVSIPGYTLNLVSKVGEMTAAQYIDIRSEMRRDVKDIAALMSLIYLPKGATYLDSSYDPDHLKREIKNNLPCTIAIGATNFFTLAFSSLIKASVSSLKKKLKKKMKKAKSPEEIQQIQSHLNLMNQSLGLIQQQKYQTSLN